MISILQINGHVLNNKSLEFARSLIYDETITDLFLVLERPSFSFRSKQSLNSMESKICEKSSTSGVDSDEFSVAPTKTNAADFHSNMNQFFHENNLVREVSLYRKYLSQNSLCLYMRNKGSSMAGFSLF